MQRKSSWRVVPFFFLVQQADMKVTIREVSFFVAVNLA
jgi:hypothetical protein